MDVKKALSTVSDPHLGFWFNNGVVVKSLKELAHALDTLDPNVFHYHVNHEKNDVFNWVQDVFSDAALAQSIKNEQNAKSMSRKIFAHIQELQSHQPAAAPAPAQHSTPFHSAPASSSHSGHDDHEKKQLFKRR